MTENNGGIVAKKIEKKSLILKKELNLIHIPRSVLFFVTITYSQLTN